MSKVNASLADVKTNMEPAPPENYRLKIEKIEETFTPAETDASFKRQNYNFTFAINDGGEHQGKKIFHNVAIHTKKGERNNAGVADMKRLYGAVLGVDPEDASFPWDDQDTDQLLNQEFRADVIIDPYIKPGSPPGTKPRMNNKINSYSITGV